MKHIYFLFGICIVLMSGCSWSSSDTNQNTVKNISGKDASSESILLQHIHQEEAYSRPENRSALLHIVPYEITPTEITIALTLDNPKEIPLSSVRSFLAFDTKTLRGIKISTPKDSPFSVVAPGEKNFDEHNGLVKIGLSTQKNTTTRKTEHTIAHITFERLSHSATNIDFYGLKEAQMTAVYAISPNNVLIDVLVPPPIPSLFLSASL